jgi:hypothetical protein
MARLERTLRPRSGDEAARGRFFLIEPQRERQAVASGHPQRQEPLGVPWVSNAMISSLSPNTFFVLGERARVRGQDRAHSQIMLCTEKHERITNARLGNRQPPP